MDRTNQRQALRHGDRKEVHAMTVWVVIVYEPWEYTEIEMVFATEAAADDYVEARRAEGTRPKFVVEPWEVTE